MTLLDIRHQQSTEKTKQGEKNDRGRTQIKQDVNWAADFPKLVYFPGSKANGNPGPTRRGKHTSWRKWCRGGTVNFHLETKLFEYDMSMASMGTWKTWMSQDDASDVAASATGTIPAGLAHFEHSKGGESIQYSDLFIYYFFSRPNENLRNLWRLWSRFWQVAPTLSSFKEQKQRKVELQIGINKQSTQFARIYSKIIAGDCTPHQPWRFSSLEVQHEAEARHWVSEAKWICDRLTLNMVPVFATPFHRIVWPVDCSVEWRSSFLSNPLPEHRTRQGSETLFGPFLCLDRRWIKDSWMSDFENL